MKIVRVRFRDVEVGDLVQAVGDQFEDCDDGEILTARSGALGRVERIYPGQSFIIGRNQPILFRDGTTEALVVWESTGLRSTARPGVGFRVLAEQGFAEDEASTPPAPRRDFLERGKPL